MSNSSIYPLSKRPLGSSGLSVSSIGLGCMGMSYSYGEPNDPESIKVLHRYVELGGNFLDTAEIYGPYKNEELIAKFLKEVSRDELVIATKFGFKMDPVTNKPSGVDSSPANIRKVCDESLKRLGIETIDLLYQHRVDSSRPIEETVGVMAELVAAGKVKALGLSEAGPEILRRASAVHPIAALQNEYSFWTRDPETNGTLAACQELGISFVAYSPLGRGFLTGAIEKASDLSEKDGRRSFPRFQGDAFEKNLELAEHVKKLAAEKGCSPAQLALAWVLGRGEHIIPIPGTKRVKYLEDNLGAAGVLLTQVEVEKIELLFPPDAATGARYSDPMMALLNT